MTWPADAVALTTDRFGLSICEAEGPLVPREQVVALAQALKDELDFRSSSMCVGPLPGGRCRRRRRREGCRGRRCGT